MKPHPSGTMQDKSGSSAQDTPSRLGLIGYPVAHSLSPAIFREYFADRPDILEHYSYSLIECDNFEDAYAAFLKDFTAVNVTAPFKENAFRRADRHDYSALRCQASNLLVKTGQTDGRQEITAYNTDFKAVGQIIRDTYGDASGRKALVIGCGGAGKAAIAAALESGMTASAYNRTARRAAEYAEHLGSYDPKGCGTFKITEASDLETAVMEADMVICTLPEPASALQCLLTGHPDIFTGKTILEASYGSPLLSTVPCFRYIPGLTWLRLQAIATYRTVMISPDRQPSRQDGAGDCGQTNG